MDTAREMRNALGVFVLLTVVLSDIYKTENLLYLSGTDLFMVLTVPYLLHLCAQRLLISTKYSRALYFLPLQLL